MIPRSVQLSKNVATGYEADYPGSKTDITASSLLKVAEKDFPRRQHDKSMLGRDEPYVDRALLRRQGRTGKDELACIPIPRTEKQKAGNSNHSNLGVASDEFHQCVLRWLQAGRQVPSRKDAISTQKRALFEAGRAVYVYRRGQIYPELVIKGATKSDPNVRSLPQKEHADVLKAIVEATNNTTTITTHNTFQSPFIVQPEDDIFANVGEYVPKTLPAESTASLVEKISFTPIPKPISDDFLPESVRTLLREKPNLGQPIVDDQLDCIDNQLGNVDDEDEDYVDLDLEGDEEEFSNTKRPLNPRLQGQRDARKLNNKLQKVEQLLKERTNDAN